MLPQALFVLTLLAQSQSPPPTAAPSALIVGRVVDAGSGQPIPGAIVQINGGGAFAMGQGPPRVMTSPSGQFVVRGLRKGNVNLTALKSGYVNASYGQLRPRGGSRPIVLHTDDEHVTGIELRMWKVGSIAGTVVDELGEPVVGASVQALERTYVAGRPRFGGFNRETPTDDRGMYEFDSLAPGDYVIGVVTTISALPTDTIDRAMRASPDDPIRVDIFRAVASARTPFMGPGTPYALGVGNLSLEAAESTGPVPQPDGGFLVYPMVFYPSAAHVGQAAVVTLGSGEHRGGIDLALHPARSVTVSGSVVGPDGPLANVGVHLTPAESDVAADPIDTALALTDPGGGFTLFGVTPGEYVIRAAQIPAPSFSMGSGGTSVVQSGSTTVMFGMGGPASPGQPPVPTAPTLAANASLTVGAVNITGLVLPAKPGGRFTGRVVFDGTADKPDANAIKNIFITPETADGSRPDFGMFGFIGHPDESGAFTTTGVPPGQYVLSVRALAHWFARSAMYKGRDLLDSAVAVDSADISGVVITYTDRTQSINGVVRDGPDPDPDAVVLLFPSDNNVWGTSGPSSRRFRTARVGTDGSYAMNTVPPGDYDIVALKGDPGDAWQDPGTLTSLAGIATALHLSEGDTKTQDLKSATIK